MTSGRPITETDLRRIVRLLARSCGNYSVVAHYTGFHRHTVQSAGLAAWRELVVRWDEEQRCQDLQDLADKGEG